MDATIAAGTLGHVDDYMPPVPTMRSEYFGWRSGATRSSSGGNALIGASPAWCATLKRASRVAATNMTTCLQGE